MFIVPSCSFVCKRRSSLVVRSHKDLIKLLPPSAFHFPSFFLSSFLNHQHRSITAISEDADHTLPLVGLHSYRAC